LINPEYTLKLLKRYRGIKPSRLRQYKEPDTYITYHEHDRDLKTFRLNLPECPRLDLIDGWGELAKDQKFKPPVIPKKLEQIQIILEQKKKDQGVNLDRNPIGLEDLFQEIKDNQKYYAKEISWIQTQWYYRENGYWFFNNGKPTYMDGWHYFYCGFWKLDIGLPAYRSRDRKFFLFARYCYTTNEAYFPYKLTYKDGSVKHLPEGKRNQKLINKLVREGEAEVEKGDFIVDMGYRTVYGFNYPKHRREGASYKAECVNFCVVSTKNKAVGGIQAMDDVTGRKVFEKQLVKPWRGLPWMFKPAFEGSDNPKSKLSMDFPSQKIGSRGAGASVKQGLQSYIDYATTANRDYYDGEKLMFYHDDETGKTTNENVYQRHQVVKQCLSQGNGSIIHGFTIKTSTVGEMTRRGGQNFFQLCMDSMYDKRDQTGQTRTGLLNLFIPAYDGLEGFVDAYGDSVIGDPTPEQAKFIKKDFGSKEFLRRKIANYEEDDSHESRAKMSEEIRLHPVQFRDCFRRSASDTGFNVQVMEDRINELQMDTTLTRRGNFEQDKDTGFVRFKDDEEGRFIVSYLLPEKDTNLKVDREGVYYPMRKDKFVASADAFKFTKTEGKRMSNGGGAVFMKRNFALDPESKSPKEWVSHRFVCTYNFRPDTKEEYCQDMLNMCLYYGAIMYPEINVPDVWDYFELNGYGGFLQYGVDNQGFEKKTPGFNTTGNGIKQTLFNGWRDYIQDHGHRERHIEVLQECSDIDGIEDMTNYDLFTAGGGCLLSITNSHNERVNRIEEDSDDLGDAFSEFDY
jgi:hypothetical protein